MPLIDRIAKSSASREMTPIPGSQVELPKPRPMDEIGVSGLLRTKGVGYVYEEWLRDLSTHRQKQIYREMRDNDAVIGAMFFAMEMILRRSEWRVEPANGKKGAQYAEFVKSCMEDMSHTWEDFVAETVSMFAFGFALFETVYKRRNGADGRSASRFDDGLIGWRKFAPRAQESILYWIWDEDGGLQGAVQLAAPDYKTVPIPIEKLLLFRTTSQKNNPEGRSMLRNCYRCFDDRTEILTRSGWKLGTDLDGTEEVATLVGGALSYEVPSAVHLYDYKGDLVHFKSRALDQMVTPNHEIWGRREHKEEFERIRADEASTYVRHKRDARWEAADVDEHEIPAYDVTALEQNGRVSVREHRESIRVRMDDWLAFLGVYVAEGFCSGGKALIEQRKDGRRPAVVGISQDEGEKADEIRRILARLPFHVCEHKGTREDGTRHVCFNICDRQLWEHLRRLGKARDKRAPAYLMGVSARQAAIFLDAFHLGDGGMSGDANGYEGTRLYFTSSHALADDLCELVLKAGGSPSVREREAQESNYGVNSIYIVTHGRQPESRPRSISRVPYEGRVWCVTTSAGVVYVRRNGKCQWSGNSWFFKRRIEEVEGIGIERDMCGLPVLYASAEAIDAMGGIGAAKKLVTNIRVDDQAGVVLPLAYDDNGNQMVKLELLKSGGSKLVDVNSTLTRYNQDMLNTILSGFIQFGESPHGSKALHMSATAIFSLAISAFMDSVAAVMNRIAIPRLMALNSMDLESAPKLVPGEIGVRDLNEISEYVMRLAQSGLTFFDEDTSAYLRKIARLPDPPDREEPPPPGSSALPPAPKGVPAPPAAKPPVGKPASAEATPDDASAPGSEAEAKDRLQGVA